MTLRLAVLVVGLSALLTLLVTTAWGGGSGDSRTIAIRYSKFSETVVDVNAGAPIAFELRNEDPILHEWIVGTPDVHERHRTGTEPYHDEVPTEVSLRPYETRLTTVTFYQPGDYLFICHLPGHEAYGMSGVIRVR